MLLIMNRFSEILSKIVMKDEFLRTSRGGEGKGLSPCPRKSCNKLMVTGTSIVRSSISI